MFEYYFLLGLRSLRRNPALTALMVLTLAVGVAASVATLTVLHVMSGDPAPGKSNRLLVPLLDVGPARSYTGERDPYAIQNTYRDSLAFMRSGPGTRRTMLYDVSTAVEPAKSDDPLVDLTGIATTTDYFGIFEVPFRYGNAWPAADDERGS